MKVTTAADLERMSPAERQAHLDRSIVRDIDDVPEEFMDRVRSRLQDRIAATEPAE